MSHHPAHPLATTLHLLDQLDPDESTFCLGPVGSNWVTCSDLLTDRAILRAWQRQIDHRIASQHHATSSAVGRAAAGTMLDWYAGIPASLVGAVFHTSHRVPSAAPQDIAFRRHATEHWVSGTALLNPRFWCLPDDPAADHPDATVVTDIHALARVARAQVRDHAEKFLAVFDPGVRLPRRSLLGAFFDALDTAAWNVELAAPRVSVIESSALLLPGDDLFPESRMHTVFDDEGVCQLSHRRIGCCETFRVEDPCSTCARAIC